MQGEGALPTNDGLSSLVQTRFADAYNNNKYRTKPKSYVLSSNYLKISIMPPPAMWIEPPGATCAGRFADV